MTSSAAAESPVAAAATAYVRRGWCPIPLPHGTKNPNFGGWQNTRIPEAEVPSYFNGTPKNIGLLLGEPSGGLVDVDLDCPEAVLLGERMLPPTGFVFGHRSKPGSHRFYLCESDPPPTTKFLEVGGATLLELRGTGAQTVVPPSTHTSGEAIEFVVDAPEPEPVDGPFLSAMVARLAAACILARHSPAAGSRHDFRNALAGGLTRAGWDADDVAAFVRGVCLAARHEDLDDAETAARTTHERHRTGGRFTGWSTLVKLIGDDGKAVVTKAAAWLGIRPEDQDAEAPAAPEPGRFRLIVLDAFYRFLPRDMDENDNGTMAQLYNQLDSYAARLGCSFVLIHHASKGSQAGKSVTDVGAGAGSQSRATDTHLVLRQHEEDGAVVMDAAVRSWPPLSPMCLRWSFPIWTPDPLLDPTHLRREGSRKRKDEDQSADDCKTPWTVDLFVQRFVDKAGKTKDEILVDAEAAGLSLRKAEQFLGAAVAKNVAFKWSLGRAVKEKFSTEREPQLIPAPESPKSGIRRRKR